VKRISDQTPHQFRTQLGLQRQRKTAGIKGNALKQKNLLQRRKKGRGGTTCEEAATINDCIGTEEDSSPATDQGGGGVESQGQKERKGKNVSTREKEGLVNGAGGRPWRCRGGAGRSLGRGSGLGCGGFGEWGLA